jgi:tripartite-type tricarboxylate transporter receptor subunit TctC
LIYTRLTTMMETFMKRRLLLSHVVAMCAAMACSTASAQAWPSKPIRAIVPFSAGGGTDVASRIVLQKVGEILGQNIVIENKGGAGGTLGYAELAKARPDGYTLGVAGTNLAYMSLLYPGLSFNPTVDLVAVAPLAGVTLTVAANPKLPVRNMTELLAYARSQKVPLSYATAGVATPQHLAGELLAKTMGVQLTHVPYKGTAPALADVVGGHVPLTMVGLPSALPYVKNNQLKILGVAASRRSNLAPDLPTLGEMGLKDFEASFWYDVRVPKDTPKSIIEQLQRAITQAISSPDVQATLVKAGFEPMTADPSAYEQALKADGDKWVAVVRDNKIRAD